MKPFLGCMPPNPREPGAARQAKEHRFCLVVAGMAKRDNVGAGGHAGAGEEVVTRGARRVFERAPLAASRAPARLPGPRRTAGRAAARDRR